MESSPQSQRPSEHRWLEIEEVRLVSDLRILHSQVHEIFNTINVLRRCHDASDIEKYADHRMLVEDVDKIDQIYLWFVCLKEKLNHIKSKKPGPDLDSHLNSQ